MEVKVTRGCPQGGVLSPLLWSLVVDDLLVKLNSRGYYAQAYADDIVIFIREKFPGTISEIMSNALKCLDEWCTGEGLSINPRKTIIIPFTRRRNLGGLVNLTLSGVKIELCETVKYLGITLDQRPTWSKHLDIAIHKARWTLMVSRRMLGLKWGLKPHKCHWLYVTMVRPQVAYETLVWWQKAQQTMARNKLASLQRLACLCTSGAFRTPTAALEVLLGLLPLDLYIKAEARMAAYRIITANNWRGSFFRSGHSTNIDTVPCNLVLNMPSDCMYSKYTFKRPFTIRIGEQSDWNGKKSPELPWCHLVFFTDGSRTDNKSGAGVFGFTPKTNISLSLGTYATVFQAEVSAILTCKNLCEKRYSGRHILIHTDSQAALMVLNSHQVNSRLVWECIQALVKLSTQNHMELCWVPGHRGIEGNEEADKLEKELTLLSLDQNLSAELARVLPRPQFTSGLGRIIKKNG
jgi:ribonuclease HI